MRIFAAELIQHHMAIGYGLTGKVKGKLGSSVYRIDRGRQIISEYNPAPHDAKGESQVEQRARIACASKVSALFTPAMIAGMATKNRTARGAFMADLVGKVVLTATESGHNATIDPTQIKLSRGAAAMVQFGTLNSVSPENTFHINVPYALPADSLVTHILVVILPVLTADEEFEAAQLFISDDLYNGRTEGTIECDMGFAMKSVRRTYYVYGIPLMVNEEKIKATYGIYLKSDTNGRFLIEVLTALANRGMLRQSIYVGNITVNPS